MPSCVHLWCNLFGLHEHFPRKRRNVLRHAEYSWGIRTMTTPLKLMEYRNGGPFACNRQAWKNIQDRSRGGGGASLEMLTLEFYLHVYFATLPLRHGHKEVGGWIMFIDFIMYFSTSRLICCIWSLPRILLCKEVNRSRRDKTDGPSGNKGDVSYHQRSVQYFNVFLFPFTTSRRTTQRPWLCSGGF